MYSFYIFFAAGTIIRAAFTEGESEPCNQWERRIQQGCRIKRYKGQHGFTRNKNLISKVPVNSPAVRTVNLLLCERLHNARASLKFIVSGVYTFPLSYRRVADTPDRAERVESEDGKERWREGKRWNMWRCRRATCGPWGDRQLKEEVGREVYLRRLSRRGAALTARSSGWELFIVPKVEAGLFFSLMEKKEGEIVEWFAGLSQLQRNMVAVAERWAWEWTVSDECWHGLLSWDRNCVARERVCAENSRVFFSYRREMDEPHRWEEFPQRLPHKDCCLKIRSAVTWCELCLGKDFPRLPIPT